MASTDREHRVELWWPSSLVESGFLRTWTLQPGTASPNTFLSQPTKVMTTAASTVTDQPNYQRIHLHIRTSAENSGETRLCGVSLNSRKVLPAVARLTRDTRHLDKRVWHVTQSFGAESQDSLTSLGHKDALRAPRSCTFKMTDERNVHATCAS